MTRESGWRARDGFTRSGRNCLSSKPWFTETGLMQPRFWITRLFAALQDAGSDITKLRRRELVSLDVRDQDAFAIDDRRVERVIEQPFVREGMHPEQPARPFDIRRQTREKSPRIRVGIPLARVARE